ncbi:C2 domain-containing protein 5 [Trichinella pseudospiralis]|uniref:C2 domain-containing protein 5 n=1 Tax=Trichinella pseudospiralis TaxID=6337 RepID=A0A0V1EXL1_TRIPS|nr:C2 domain-containing protein 5 [Trichinella pseudospiralis]
MPGTLKVRIISGRGFPVMDRSNETTDAFVEVKFGQSVHRTEIYPKSLNPKWDTDWFCFEAEEENLQDECLQIRVMDYDTYSANDSIGRVYVDLTPLLHAKKREISGWFPIYDTMNGVRGEIYVVIGIDLFADINRFRKSSFNINVFATSAIPVGQALINIHGFVDELITSSDPEYEWIDKIRTPRASNEVRQSLFSKIAGELTRRIGKKAAEMGGNAVIGYTQYFDFEGELGIVIRGNGTVVTLEKCTACSTSLIKEKRERLSNSAGFEQHFLNVQKFTPSRRYSNPKQMQSRDHNILTSENICGKSAAVRLYKLTSVPAEYPFLTVRSLPTELLVSLGGTVAAHSVKLLRGNEKPEDRHAWWRELRLEICGHMTALGCNSVIGYREDATIRDDICAMTAIGTAAVMNFSLWPSSVLIHAEMGKFYRAVCAASFPQDFPSSSKILKNSISVEKPCTMCHILPRAAELHLTKASSICQVCLEKPVPSVLLSTTDQPPELTEEFSGSLVQARVIRKKSGYSGEQLAQHLTNILPFIEHEAHSQVISQTSASGKNAVFGIQRQFSIGEEMVVLIVTGTAVFLPALANPKQKEPFASAAKGEENPVDSKEQRSVVSFVENLSNSSGSNSESNSNDEEKFDKKIKLKRSKNAILIAADCSLGHTLTTHSSYPIVCTFCDMSKFPNIAKRAPYFHNTFTRIVRFNIHENELDETFLSNKLNWIAKSTVFKFRKMEPIVFAGIMFSVHIGEDSEMQICSYGVALTGKSLVGQFREKEKQRDDFVEEFSKIATSESAACCSSSSSGRWSRRATLPWQSACEELEKAPVPYPMTVPETFITALLEPPLGMPITSYLGYYDFFFIRETTAVRDIGGLEAFVQIALAEILHVVQAHVTAFGGQGMVSFKFSVTELSYGLSRNQVQFLIGISGDIVTHNGALGISATKIKFSTLFTWMDLHKIIVCLAFIFSNFILQFANCSCPYLDGVEKQLYFKECDQNQDNHLPFKILKVEVKLPNGSISYPINISTPLYVHVQLNNTLNRPVNKILSDMSLYMYANVLWLRCSWIHIPTFDHLKDIDQCQNCPLSEGLLELQIAYDFTQAQCIMPFIQKGTPYGMDISVRDGENPSQNLACFQRVRDSLLENERVLEREYEAESLREREWLLDERERFLERERLRLRERLGERLRYRRSSKLRSLGESL